MNMKAIHVVLGDEIENGCAAKIYELDPLAAARFCK